MPIITQRIDGAAIATALKHAATVPPQLSVRHDENLSNGITRVFLKPAFAERLHRLSMDFDVCGLSLAGADRALAPGALSVTIHKALSESAAEHAEHYRTELQRDSSRCPVHAAFASKIRMPVLQAVLMKLRHQLNVAEQDHIFRAEPNPPEDLQAVQFRRERRRATDFIESADRELRLLYPEHFKGRITEACTTLPVSSQTKAVMELTLAHNRQGDVVARYKRACELATNHNTQAFAELALAQLGDGNVVARLKRVLELATYPGLRAGAELRLAQLGDGDVLGRYRRILEIACDRNIRAQAELVLGVRGEGDRVTRFKRALELATDPNLVSRAELCLAKCGDGDVPARLKHVLELTTDPLPRSQAELKLAMLGDGDVVARLKRALGLAISPQTQAAVELELAKHGDGDVTTRLKRARDLATKTDTRTEAQAILDRRETPQPSTRTPQPRLKRRKASHPQKALP